MKTDSLVKAIRATKGLTTLELQELRAHLNVLLQFGPSSADRAVATAEAPEELLMIAQHGRDKGGALVPVTDLMHAKQYDTFKVKLPRVQAFIAQVGSKNAQRGLFRLGLVLLERDIRMRRMTPSYMQFMNEVHRIPALINREFPGYAANGMLRLIIRGEKGNVRKEQRKRDVQRKRRTAAG